MQNWDSAHWTALALVVAGIGAMISGLDSWREAIAPPFVGGALIQIAGVLRAIYSGNAKQS